MKQKVERIITLLDKLVAISEHISSYSIYAQASRRGDDQFVDLKVILYKYKVREDDNGIYIHNDDWQLDMKQIKIGDDYELRRNIRYLENRIYYIEKSKTQQS